VTRPLASLAILPILALLSASAFANSGELMTFYGLGDQQPAGNFYNGGGIPGTPNYGVTFSSNFLGLVSVLAANPGSGNYLNVIPGANVNIPAALFVIGNTGSQAVAVMNVSGGFTTGLNFFYTASFAVGQTETVRIWSGANGTGIVLATISLSSNNATCGSSLVAYCNWSLASSSFTSGTAHSVTFTGPANELGIAQVTIGSSGTAIPEPASFYLIGAGLIGISAPKIRRLLGL
jgi:hypothetical protein